MKNVAKDIHKSVGKLTLAALAVIAVQTVCGQAVRCSEPVTTASLQAAIDRVSKSGGGRVEVPSGTWAIGTVWLRSGVELHLPEGAVLKGSANLDDYNAEDAYPQNFCFGSEGWSARHLIIALEVRNVAITGKGAIDGFDIDSCDDVVVANCDIVTGAARHSLPLGSRDEHCNHLEQIARI